LHAFSHFALKAVLAARAMKARLRHLSNSVAPSSHRTQVEDFLPKVNTLRRLSMTSAALANAVDEFHTGNLQVSCAIPNPHFPPAPTPRQRGRVHASFREINGHVIISL
jgi:hypothetical protein